MVLAAIDSDGGMSRALRAAGLRVTMPRLAMLTWLDGHPHATVDAITAGVRERFGTVSTQAVYDMLAACAAAGLLRRIEPAGHPARFERRAGDNHHHLVCRRCGRTEDVDRAIGAQPCLTAAEDLGFTVDEAEVVFWGVCPACRAADSSADGKQRDEEAWQ
ncbi:MAG TPA: transcriptional repressor [Streptosporangiaceae bacterium]|jgi:Fur family ferric uptake transcriptional regulator|nr:transcriptional repressor [Streptosporangiaceae bacterium]